MLAIVFSEMLFPCFVKTFPYFENNLSKLLLDAQIQRYSLAIFDKTGNISELNFQNSNVLETILYFQSVFL